MLFQNTSNNIIISITFDYNYGALQTNQISIPQHNKELIIKPQQIIQLPVNNCNSGTIIMFVWNVSSNTKDLVWRGYLPCLIDKTVYVNPETSIVTYDNVQIPQCPELETYVNMPLSSKKKDQSLWLWIILALCIICFFWYLSR
jgi:hypothetical protein